MNDNLIKMIKIWPVFNVINPLNFYFKLICIIMTDIIINNNNNNCTCSCHTQIQFNCNYNIL